MDTFHSQLAFHGLFIVFLLPSTGFRLIFLVEILVEFLAKVIEMKFRRWQLPHWQEASALQKRLFLLLSVVILGIIPET